MIKLCVLPGVVFNMPHFNTALVKGYLEENNITCKQIDLSIEFFAKCINSTYIKEKHPKYYSKLSKNDKKIVDQIDDAIYQLKTKKINTDDIITANDTLQKFLNIYSSYYNINWSRRGLNFSLKINTIDELLELSYNEKNKIFDCILNTNNLKENDIFYFFIQYPFQLPYAIRYAKKIKEVNSKVKIILGGDYITHIIKNSYELMTKCNYIDSIVFFSNYNSLLQLIKNYQNIGKNNYKIPNTYIREKNNIIVNEIEKNSSIDQDKYTPSFEGLDLEKYISNVKLIPMMLNHGCYHSKCKFCSRYFYYNGYCKYNIDKIFNLIKKEYETNKIEAIYFIDECIPPSILIKLANFLLENNIKIIWMVETRIDNKLLDKEIPKLLFESGCREISFGIESYNKKILKDMNKGIDIKKSKKIMKNFFKSGISVSATFMIGYPTESIINIFKTLNFIKKFKYLDTFGLSIFNYMRNSILVNESNIDESTDLNLIYRTNNDNNELYSKLIDKFNLSKKIKEYANIRNKLLYRAEYMYLDKKIYSLNKRIRQKENYMKIKNIFKKKSSNDVKELIYLKELKPEMTQCRIVQVDKKIKEKENDKI